MSGAKRGPPAAKKPGPKRRPAQRARAAAGRPPQTQEEAADLVLRATTLMMSRGIKACLAEKIPSAIVLMAASEQVGIIASMMGLPYPQALQAACNGVESAYRASAAEQVDDHRPVDQVTEALSQRALAPAKTPQNRCELGKGGTTGG